MTDIMFIKPALEIDATWDPIRTCNNLGISYLASKSKEAGFNASLLDEIVRDGGFQKRRLFIRIIERDKVTETPIDSSYEDYQLNKINDYYRMSAKEFVNKYSAFQGDKIIRIIARVGNSPEQTLNEIGRLNPKVVGIPVIASANYGAAVGLAKAIRKEFPNIRIISGGQHISSNPDSIDKVFDHVFTGDAINTIVPFLEGKCEDRVVEGKFEKMVSFPLLDLDFLNLSEYPKDPTHTYPTEGRGYVDYMFSKGCFRNCDFCFAGSQEGNHVTPLDYDKVKKQLRRFKQAGIQEIVVQDDAFLWKPKTHLKTILDLMKEQGFYWQNNGGVEFEMLNDEVRDMFIHYNSHGDGRITALYVPFNPRGWNKGQSAGATMAEKYHNSLENLKKLREEAGIYVFSSNILGTPEHSLSVLKHDSEVYKALLSEGYLDAVLPLSATMIPGTEWYNHNGHNIVSKIDYPGFSLFSTHHNTEQLNARDIEMAMVNFQMDLRNHQETYSWQSAFPTGDTPIK